METPEAKSKLGFWHGVAVVPLVLLALFIVFLALMPIFSRARRASPSSTAHYEMMAKSAGLSPSEDQAAPWPAALAAEAARMVVRTADLSLEVRDAKGAEQKITDIAAKAGGFVTASSISGEENAESGQITVRVPAAGYASVLSEVSKLGKVLSKQEKGEDVTEEYVDLQSRLRNLKREEEAFLGVLAKSKRVTDILAVESELNRVRGEIEQAVGRAKYLQNQVALSTITVNITEPTPVVTQAIKWDVVQTVLRAVHALGAVFRAIASLLIWLVIFIPLWLLVVLVVRVTKRLRGRPAGQ